VYEEALIALENTCEGLSTFITEVFKFKGDHYVSCNRMKRMLTQEQYRILTSICITTIFFENGN
jgi:hypothetical protein